MANGIISITMRAASRCHVVRPKRMQPHTYATRRSLYASSSMALNCRACRRDSSTEPLPDKNDFLLFLGVLMDGKNKRTSMQRPFSCSMISIRVRLPYLIVMPSCFIVQR